MGEIRTQGLEPAGQPYQHTGKNSENAVGKTSSRTVKPAAVDPTMTNVVNNQSPATDRSVHERSITSTDHKTHYETDLDFFDFQLRAAQELAKPGPVSDDLIVYWQSDDGTIIALDPKDKECPEFLSQFYDQAKTQFQANSDDIEHACQDQRDKALQSSTATLQQNKEDAPTDYLEVSYHHFFSMVNKEHEWEALLADYSFDKLNDIAVKEVAKKNDEYPKNANRVAPSTKKVSRQHTPKNAKPVNNHQPNNPAKASGTKKDEKLITQVATSNNLKASNKIESPNSAKKNQVSPSANDWNKQQATDTIHAAERQLATKNQPIMPSLPAIMPPKTRQTLVEEAKERAKALAHPTHVVAPNILSTKKTIPVQMKLANINIGQLTNGNFVIIGEKGKYITLENKQPVKGFDDAIYVMNIDDTGSISLKKIQGRIGDQLVKVGNSFVAIPEGKVETIINTSDNKRVLVCINGQTKELPDISHVVSGFSDQAYLIGRSNHKVLPVEMDRPLQRAIEFFSSDSDLTAQNQLQNFFDSPLAAVLSGRAESQQSGEEAQGEYLDTALIKPFISAYKEAILRENKGNSLHHQTKKARRLKAINSIEAFIKAQNSDAPDYKKNCQLACQLLLRVREPGFVQQLNTPLCGGFALAKQAWRTKPDIITDQILNLHSNKQMECMAQNGKAITIKAPASASKLASYQEDLADKLLIHSLYSFDKDMGSNTIEDAYKANFLGLNALIFNQNEYPKDTQAQNKMLTEMESASRQKSVIKLSFNPEATAQLKQDQTAQELPRKSSKKQRLQLPIKAATDISSGHAILVEHFEVKDDDIIMKLHTWGKTSRYQMKKKNFFDCLEPIAMPTILSTQPMDNTIELFTEPPYEKVFHNHTTHQAHYHDCEGNKIVLKRNKVYEGLSGTHYMCNAAGGYISAGEDEYFDQSDDETSILVKRRSDNKITKEMNKAGQVRLHDVP
ncbi:MAG: hypothetical protein PUP46_00735 [Endozoicomonas sp. (ex Botrylloides leachii)]|nr:hypothetical protein [Endozoicomonas sp. (ex Botrylloides leachii)]